MKIISFPRLDHTNPLFKHLTIPTLHMIRYKLPEWCTEFIMNCIPKYYYTSRAESGKHGRTRRKHHLHVLPTTTSHESTIYIHQIWIYMYLEIHSSDVATSKELYWMLLFIERVVINRRVFRGIPVKHKFTVIKTSNTFLLLDHTQVTLLQNSKCTRYFELVRSCS